MRTSLAKLVALAALLVGPCWGCGSSSGTLAPLIAVKGKVTYKGQPVTKGVRRVRAGGLQPAGQGAAPIRWDFRAHHLQTQGWSGRRRASDLHQRIRQKPRQGSRAAEIWEPNYLAPDGGGQPGEY